MGDEYGRMEWQTDEAAATAEAVRRIDAAIASGATVLDFADLSAMTRLPDALAKAQGVREIHAGEARAIRAIADKFFVRRLTNISALAGLTKLTSLDLGGTQVSDLSALSGLSGLAILNLKHTKVSDLAPLFGLSGLTSLDLTFTRVSELSALSGLSELTSLNLSSTVVSDLSALSGLSALTSLDLSRTQFSDLSALSGLSGLTSLNLSSTAVSDLSALSGLSGLTFLNLSDTRVSDLSALSGLSGITSLGLSDTKVSDLSALSGLSGLTELSVSYTKVSNLAALNGMSRLTLLDLSGTGVSDISFLLYLPLFASEQARFLSYENAAAANPKVDSRLDLLSRLPPDRCAIATVQYLKGTHPDFGTPQGNGLVNDGVTGLAERLAEASPVDVVLADGLLQARNAGAPERLAPKELGLRVTALREQVGELLHESRGKQMPEDLVRRFQRYAKALDHDEVTYLFLDGPIAALRGGLNDPYVTDGLDGGFVESWRALVTMHDELRPLLLPPEEDDLPELRKDVTVEEGIDLAAKAETVLQDAVNGGIVHPSIVEAAQAATEYFKAARDDVLQKPTWIKRGVSVLGGLFAKILEFPARLGLAAAGAIKVQEFLLTPAGQALVAALRPLWEVILRFFV